MTGMSAADGAQIDRTAVSFAGGAAPGFIQKKLNTAHKISVRILLLTFAVISIIVMFLINFVFESKYSPDAAWRAGQNLGRVTDAAQEFPAAETGLAQPEEFAGDIAEDAGDLEQFSQDIDGDWDEFSEITEDAELAFEDDGTLADGELVLDEIPQGTILEKNSNLLRHESDGDVFALLSTWKGLLNTVIGNELFFVNNKYDANLRLASRTEWQKNEGASNHETIKRTVYAYADDASVTALTRDVYSYIDDTREKTEYDSDGLPLRVIITKGGEKPETVSETKYTYDSKRRVIEKTSRWFSQGAPGRKETSRYAYTGKAQTPDLYIYQNDVLSYSAVYDADGNYTEMRVLTGDYSVSTRYENNEKVREVYMLNEKEFRRFEY
ncbi:MAG: hypothetical protein Pg6C_12150 [Treponemataceae bacterium]|nr:MAG: hypothetical protein Pg6C_12150 [Treponemataceae bacterium]